LARMPKPPRPSARAALSSWKPANGPCRIDGNAGRDWRTHSSVTVCPLRGRCRAQGVPPAAVAGGLARRTKLEEPQKQKVRAPAWGGLLTKWPLLGHMLLLPRDLIVVHIPPGTPATTMQMVHHECDQQLPLGGHIIQQGNEISVQGSPEICPRRRARTSYLQVRWAH
jgi:hypothetical protein